MRTDAIIGLEIWHSKSTETLYVIFGLTTNINKHKIIIPTNVLFNSSRSARYTGTRDLNGASIITVEADKLITAGLNCYEIATVLLFYSTIPIK